jgi:hypothetical protein
MDKNIQVGDIVIYNNDYYKVLGKDVTPNALYKYWLFPINRKGEIWVAEDDIQAIYKKQS